MTLKKACTAKLLAAPEKQDQYDRIFMSFATKMRKMEPRLQIFVESLIHKIITKGMLGKLNENVDIVNNYPQYFQLPPFSNNQQYTLPHT